MIVSAYVGLMLFLIGMFCGVLVMGITLWLDDDDTLRRWFPQKCAHPGCKKKATIKERFAKNGKRARAFCEECWDAGRSGPDTVDEYGKGNYHGVRISDPDTYTLNFR